MYSRLIAISAMFALFSISIVSCSYVEEQAVVSPDPQDVSDEWTVLFYGAGCTSSDLTTDGRSLVLETFENIRRVYAVESVNVLAALSSNLTQNEIRVYSLLDEQQGNSDLTYETWGRRDMSSPQTLSEFINFGIANYPADKIAVVMMGDGNSWQGVIRDEVNGLAPMSLSGFKSAIEESAEHVDLIAWFVPGMSSVETAYECRTIADYMVGCAWPLAHDVTSSPRVWLMDLMQNPQMGAARLGEMMVDGLYESAADRNDSVNYALLELGRISILVPEIDSLSIALRPYTEDHALELPALWSAAWVASTDDSQSVDVGRLSTEVLDDPTLASDPHVAEAAQHVISSLEELVVYRRTTLTGDTRHGVSIFLPSQPDSAMLSDYAVLSLSSDHPGWYLLLQASMNNAPVFSQISGSARWAGNVIENIYLFLNANQFGSPALPVTQTASITEVVTQDSVRFVASFALREDSLSCYVGIFQDLDFSGTLTTGDRYGYYHQNAQPQRDWITLRSGETLSGIHIELDRTF